MEQIDREKAQRVWRRVQGDRSMSPMPVAPAQILQPNPEGLLLGELTDTQLLLQLSRGKDSPLRQLAAQSQSRAAVLRGICRLSGLSGPAELPKPEVKETSAALRRLMGQLLRRLREYRQLCAHEEFGPLYETLAHQTQDSAAALARIIGK